MTPNEIAAAAEQTATEMGSETVEAMRDMWATIAAKIDEVMDASGLLHKRYLAQDCKRKARLAMLKAFVNGSDLDVCAAAARRAGGLI